MCQPSSKRQLFQYSGLAALVNAKSRGRPAFSKNAERPGEAERETLPVYAVVVGSSADGSGSLTAASSGRPDAVSSSPAFLIA